MTRASRSPYELTVGSALDDLHPVLRRYFGAVPAGMRGYGHGVFEAVGTPRRWLRPLLGMLARQGILFPVWEKNVPFTVVNAPMVDRDGRVAVVAVRRFHFAKGAESMIDAITAENPGADGLVDHLGADRLLRVRLSARVVRGELHLHSTALEVRVGRHHLAVPAAIAPRVTLVERFDDAAEVADGTGVTPPAPGAQRVTVQVDAPGLGTLYRYTGAFHYELRAAHDHEAGTGTGTATTGAPDAAPTSPKNAGS